MKLYVAPAFVDIITFGFAAGITLWPLGIFFTKRRFRDNLTLRTHEKIHWKQQQGMLGVFFYLWYLIEWLIRLPKHGRSAYYRISFEREAYENQHNPNYPEVMSRWSWTKYV